MCNIRLQAPTLARKRNISHWLACGADGLTGELTGERADGRAGGRAGGWTYVHVTTKISWMDW